MGHCVNVSSKGHQIHQLTMCVLILAHFRPVQYKHWLHADMLAATKAVIADGMSGRQAAELHQVPKSTRGDRISGRVLPGAKSGPPMYLRRGRAGGFNFTALHIHCSKRNTAS